MSELLEWKLPAEAWKWNRDRMVKKAKRGLHVTETNPGPAAFRLRYDYILTAAELTKLVEDVMLETERLCIQFDRVAVKRAARAAYELESQRQAEAARHA